jgi:hypothetical protein
VDAQPVLHPVGPLPPRVYWIRRAVLVAVVLVLVIGIAVSCAGGSGPKHPAAGPSTSPTPAGTGKPAPAACEHGALAVTASTDADRYAAGTLPRLKVTIHNTGAACVLTESPSARSWTIVSGADQIWTTAGCSSSHTATQTTLKAGGSVSHSLVWNRHRTGKACAVSATQAAPGTYQLTVTVNGVTSGPAIFHLTG